MLMMFGNALVKEFCHSRRISQGESVAAATDRQRPRSRAVRSERDDFLDSRYECANRSASSSSIEIARPGILSAF